MVLLEELLNSVAFDRAVNDLAQEFREKHGLPAIHQLGLVVPNVEAAALSLEEGVFKPVLLAWELESRRSREDLLRSVIEIQILLGRRQLRTQSLLQYVGVHNQRLFTTIQEILRKRLENLD